MPGLELNGASVEVPVTGADIFPTLIDVAGLPLLPGQHIDGSSLKPLLEGKDLPGERSLYWHYPHYGNQGGEPSSIIRSGPWKLIHYWEDNRQELFREPFLESPEHNLIVDHPGKAHELAGKLEAWLTKVNAKRPKPDPFVSEGKRAARALWVKDTLLPRLEGQRERMLDSGYAPNSDWWGSAVDSL